MLCPHLECGAPETAKWFPNPMYIIPPRLYGLMDIQAFVEDAEDIIALSKENGLGKVLHFPGEERAIRISRTTSCRRRKEKKKTYRKKTQSGDNTGSAETVSLLSCVPGMDGVPDSQKPLSRGHITGPMQYKVSWFMFFLLFVLGGAIFNGMKARKKTKHVHTGILLILCTGIFLTAGEYIDVRNARIARENALQDALAKDRAYTEERTGYGYRIIEERNALYEAEQTRLTQLKNDPQYRADAVQTETLPLSAIGDSVMLGAADVMRNTFVNASVDAEVSRSQYALLDIVIDDVSVGTLGNPVVIGIGTNGPLSPSVCEEVIDLCGKRDIFWLTTTNNWQFDNTDTILALPDTHSNVTIIDWDTISAGHSEYFYNDGIHLTPAGRSAYTEAIKESLTAYYWDHLPEEPDHRIFIAGDEALLSCVSKIPSSTDIYLYGDENLSAESLNQTIEELKAEGNLGTTQVLVINEERENVKELVDLCSSLDGFLYVIMVQKPGSKPLNSFPGADSVSSFITQEQDLMLDGIRLNAGAVNRLADFIITQINPEN